MSSKIQSLTFCVLTVLLSVTTVSSAGHHHHAAAAPSPTVDCITVVSGMVDCLSFVTNGSTATKPDANCCSELKTVLQTAPQCLCEGFKSSQQLGVSLNISKALTLPSVCHLKAPSYDNCGLSVSPAAAPTGGAMSPMAGGAVSPTAGGGMAPAPGTGGSDGLRVSIGSVMMGIMVVVASFTSF